MAPSETSQIIKALEKSREDFHAAVSGLPEALAATRPEADRWSVLECVEHVATAEEIFLKRLTGGEHSTAPAEDKGNEAALAARLEDRSTRRQAPEVVLPRNRFTSLAEALEQFDRARGRTVQFAQERAADLYTLATEHRVFGPLNGMETLVIVASHSRRHAKQIREIRAALEKL